jgi:hypothetical protein
MDSRYCVEDLQMAIVLVTWLMRLAEEMEETDTEIDLGRARLSFSLALDRLGSHSFQTRA